ncbi:protein trichome birefringence-like 13 isoform X2 [Elaeis guineensis]|uniref:protein trichome birefringence-like 13 isoform X2 n=1 Tax=Elaeis guineensis var. tenera TaxID=51953 RepID=UPI003C6D968C
MAARDPARRHLSTTTLSCLAALVCLASLLFLFSFRSSLDRQPSRSSPRFLDRLHDPSERWWRAPCNYYDGAWVWDPDSVAPRYDMTCKEIFKGWNCIANHKSNGPDLLRWRWKPSSCDLPRIDPLRFLERYRNISIGFVGDSLNRNMFVSLVCMLRGASNQVKKWRPAGADRGFTFLSYNVTVAYHRTNLLVRYGRWSASSNASALESLGYKQGYRVDVDVPDQTWAEAPRFHDILIFNTGHWWLAPSKFDPVQSPMLFFEKGLPVLPHVSPEVGLDMALKHMVLYVERIGIDAVKFFRTQSPRHFEGGDWNKGGSCRRIQPLLPGQRK